MDRRNTSRTSRLILADGRNTARVVRLAPPSDRIVRAEWYT
jgi:hypothetical protein